jgi:hypothetical protein
MSTNHTTLLPHASETVQIQWRSTRYAASYYNRVERVIRRWCVDGTFADREIPVYRDASGRWWIRIEESEQTANFGA